MRRVSEMISLCIIFVLMLEGIGYRGISYTLYLYSFIPLNLISICFTDKKIRAFDILFIKK